MPPSVDKGAVYLTEAEIREAPKLACEWLVVPLPLEVMKAKCSSRGLRERRRIEFILRQFSLWHFIMIASEQTSCSRLWLLNGSGWLRT